MALWYVVFMKTTLEISDAILIRAKELAREQDVPLRSLAEEGLRMVIEKRSSRRPVNIEPVTFRGEGISPEFREASWQQIRDAAYEGSGA